MAFQRFRNQGGATGGGRGGPNFGFYKRFDGLAGSDVLRAELFEPASMGGEVTGTLVAAVIVQATFAGTRGQSGTLLGNIPIAGTFVAASGSTGTLSSSLAIQSSFTAVYGETGVLLGTVIPTSSFLGTHGVAGALTASLVPAGVFSAQHFAASFGSLVGLVQPASTFTGTFSGGVIANDNTPYIPIFSRRRSRR